MKNSIIGFVVTVGILLVGLWYVYATYYNEIYDWFGVRVTHSLFIEEVFFSVTVADEPQEWRQGLSGVSNLPDQTGLLFIFDESDFFGIWMKDMLIAIDIIWLDADGVVVHIEENITPDTYPTTYSPPTPARYVLEVPAFTVESFRITVGQQAKIPTELIPKDLQVLPQNALGS